jgi:YidC/Oxa1 family membrane protein insertase
LPRADDPVTGTLAGSSPRVVLSMAMPVPAVGQSSKLSYGVYLGPKSFRVFDGIAEQERFLPVMDVDLEPPCCGVSVPGGLAMAKALLKLLDWFHSLVGNWGVAIMMLTLLVRGAMSPLNFRMQKSMRAFGAKMAKLKPKLDEIKQKYAHDPKAHQQAMIEFQREHKMIPPLGGCLPIFLTMPIYIGLFTALRTAYDLRLEGFMLWIDDLSRPDALVELGWPFIPNLNLLPLIWIALIVVLQLRMPLPTDPQQRQMQQIMRYMPIIFGVLLYNYASGLMVYMVTSMVWSLIESSIIRRILGPMDPNAGAAVPTMM